MLVACRLAGLPALDGHYAGVKLGAQMRGRVAAPQHAPKTTSLGRHVHNYESVGPLLRVSRRPFVVDHVMSKVVDARLVGERVGRARIYDNFRVRFVFDCLAPRRWGPRPNQRSFAESEVCRKRPEPLGRLRPGESAPPKRAYLLLSWPRSLGQRSTHQRPASCSGPCPTTR
jgi:hypothetical protein